MSTIIIPIDAQQITEQDRKQQKIKVAIQQGGKTRSEIVQIEAGHSEIKIEVDPKQTASIAVGPESTSDDDLFHRQTLTANVAPAQWANQAVLTIPKVVITPEWWRIWLFWCREFTINGRLVCADGSPVPGAQVHAYDVDFFWWWSSIIQVGPTAITDASGHFTIQFRWCCGWFPWWWWRLRNWVLDPVLVEKVLPVVQLNPALRFPAPDPMPSFDFTAISSRPPQLAAGVKAPALSPALAISKQVDPTVLPTIREKLTAVLPHVPEFERLRIWPWWPWTPWLDCSPDIIFRVTQNCGGNQAKLIVNENVFQTRWDIPTTLNVTLIANSEACCLPQHDPPPQGDCALLTGVCGDPGLPLTSIGSTGPLAGYADPGGRDRPFSETVSTSGQFGTSAQADYYTLEYTPHGTSAWAQLPAGGLLDITRGFFDATMPFPNQWFYIAFPVLTFGSLRVYKSRHYYELTHPPANWGSPLTGRSWFYNVNQLASIQTNGILSDGAYDFRIAGYKALPSGDPDPASYKVLDGCGGNNENNLLVLRVDNRVVLPPTPGNVHINTTEPDCGISDVRLGGVSVLPCGSQILQPGTPLEIDFFVTDPDGHLDHYELDVKFDLGSFKNLLDSTQVGSLSLTPLSGGPEGPDYSNAVNPPESAVRPTWKGGSIRLHIDDASKVFPKTCCYLVELTVYKRNIVNCDGHLTYYNQTHYSFTIMV